MVGQPGAAIGQLGTDQPGAVTAEHRLGPVHHRPAGDRVEHRQSPCRQLDDQRLRRGRAAPCRPVHRVVPAAAAGHDQPATRRAGRDPTGQPQHRTPCRHAG